MKKKVLHVLSSNDIAGAENVAICMISNLSDSFQCIYASPEGGIRESLASRDIAYVPIKKFSFWQIRKVIKASKPDIIHAHDFRATLKCLSVFRSIPVVSHIHQNPAWLRTFNKHSMVFFLACYKISKIIVVSPAIKEATFLSHYFHRKLAVIHNIVDLKWISKNAEHATTGEYDLAFIARFEEVKDPLRFINIVSELVKISPHLKAIMLGGGTLEVECRQAIEEKKLQRNIELRGFLDNPYPVLNNSKMLVMTSKTEGLPMVAIEALSLGKPVIVPQLDGIENIIDDSCGSICKSDEQFVSTIVSCLTLDEKYRNLSLGALRRAENLCNMDMYIEQLEQVYRDAVRG